jgi:hypothetical protein
MKTLVGCTSLAAVVAVVLLLLGGGQASNPFAVAVADAAVKCPDGFTVKVHGLPAGSDPTSSLSASCVLDLGIPAGAKGPTGLAGTPGPTGAPGTNGVSGYGPVVQSINLNSSKSNIYKNQPTPDGNGWTVEAVTTVKGSKSNGSERARVTLKVTVICAVVS